MIQSAWSVLSDLFTRGPAKPPKKRPFYQECGCCGHLHAPEFRGDCRDDNSRFTYNQLDLLHGERGYDYETEEDQMLRAAENDE